MQHLDLFTWMRGDILVKADKMTMANSLELRVPFLDPEVFDVASRVPLDQKITQDDDEVRTASGAGGHRAAARAAPREAGLPGAAAALAAPARSCSTGRTSRSRSRRPTTSSTRPPSPRCSNEHREGVSDHSRRLWTVLCFMVWHGIFVEKRIVPQIQEPVYPVNL